MVMDVQTAEYRRPLSVSIIMTILGEAGLFIVFGLVLHPEGSLLNKFLWTIVFCGMGMGATVGALLVLFVAVRLSGGRAVLATAVIMTATTGVACNLLCLNLDRHFHYFGGGVHPETFFASGFLLSAVGGLMLGLLLFTERGRGLLSRVGL